MHLFPKVNFKKTVYEHLKSARVRQQAKPVSQKLNEVHHSTVSRQCERTGTVWVGGSRGHGASRTVLPHAVIVAPGTTPVA